MDDRLRILFVDSDPPSDMVYNVYAFVIENDIVYQFQEYNRE